MSEDDDAQWARIIRERDEALDQLAAARASAEAWQRVAQRLEAQLEANGLRPVTTVEAT
jgi:hypothetical protein